MISTRSWILTGAVLTAVLFTTAWGDTMGAPGLDPSHVLVLYNTASADGADIASYYKQVHPQVRVLGISAPTGEQITADEYLTLRSQILATGALDSTVDCLVTTKGMPLRICNTSGSGLNRYSSLESELTRIDTISSKTAMKAAFPLNPLTINPYYYVDAPFSYAAQQIRLTSRLDAFTAQDVKNSIDTAQRAMINRPGYGFLLDDAQTNTNGLAPFDLMESLRDNVLAPRNQPYVYDGTNATVATAPGPVIGYVTHGVNAGASSDYILNGLNFPLADGAVFVSYESYNAYTFTSGVTAPAEQGLLAQWIQKGGAAATGNVYEPSAGSETTTNEDRLFDMLLKGYSWAEAAWNATQQLSYVNTVLGDPLMRYRQWQPGDCDNSGVVDVTDYGIWFTNYGTDAPAGDLNGDGAVDMSDYVIWFSNYGAGSIDPVPEPATVCLLAIGSLALIRRRK